ncbi:MAG: restriction endonuclease [Bacteroides cellulosilyticus]
MPNYNLNVLQPAEFEDLARDLIQKQFGVFVESFTTGRDSGIDLRFATHQMEVKSIVQAKRYKDYWFITIQS